MSTTDPNSCTHRNNCPSSTQDGGTSSLSVNTITTSNTYTTYDPNSTNTSNATLYSNNPSGSQATPSTILASYTSPSHASTTPALSSSPTSSATPAPVIDAATSTPNAGAIAGGVIGGVIFLVCIALGILLYLRARKRKRTAPSSEFMESMRAGNTPVLRLDSGAEYTPALPEKGGYSAVPPPFMQNSYYTSPATEKMRLPDSMMISDIPSSRPSVEKPLHPQRFSDHPTTDSYTDKGHRVNTSIGSRRELWSSDIEMVASRSPTRQSPGGRDALEFAARYSMDEPPPRSFSVTPRESVFPEVAGEQSPPPRVLSPSLQPLRRQEST